MSAKYNLGKDKRIYLVRDKETVDFHIDKNDYFGTLSTIIELMNQDYVLENKTEIKKILKNLKKDLLYLQKNFDIIKKTQY